MKLRILVIVVLICSVIQLHSHSNHKKSSNGTDDISDKIYVQNNDISIAMNSEGIWGLDDSWDSWDNFAYRFLLYHSFYITSIINDTLTGEQIADFYQSIGDLIYFSPGPSECDEADPRIKIYSFDKYQFYSGEINQEWIDAVALGAHYIDNNQNENYDPDIDYPEMMGDFTSWLTTNDEYNLGNYNGLPRMGLEVQLMSWFYNVNPYSFDENTIFFRYRIIHKGKSHLDSLYLTFYSEFDLGDYNDDLAGCDTTLDLFFVYNDGADQLAGVAPPAYGLVMLQGPLVPSPGSTAKLFLNPFEGAEEKPDYKNLRPTSTFGYRTPFKPQLDWYFNLIELRRSQKGSYDASVGTVDPMTYKWGPSPVPANPNFIFSGDPVTGTGWVDLYPHDKLITINCGPFFMSPGDTQDVIIALVKGKGESPLGSVAVLKENVAELWSVWNDLLVNDLPEDNSEEIPVTFALKQNYPNPFNPVTTIPYELNKSADIHLAVFNVLGEHIKTLVDGTVLPGYHEIQWDGSNHTGEAVSSGIYIVRMNIGSRTITRKMVLLK